MAASAPVAAPDAPVPMIEERVAAPDSPATDAVEANVAAPDSPATDAVEANVTAPDSPPIEQETGAPDSPVAAEAAGVAASATVPVVAPNPVVPTPPAPAAPRWAALRTWLRAERGVALGLVAAILGGLGEALLFPEGTRGAGAVVLAGAMLMAALAWRNLPDAPLLPLRPAGLQGLITWRSGLVVRLVGIGGAVGLAVEGLLAWLIHPDEIFGLQGIFWLGSMGLLLISCARWYPATQTEADLGPPWTRAEVLAFAGIIALSFFSHLAWLYEIPWRFHFDEAIAYTESMRFYKGPLISMFTTTWWNTSLPSMWFPFTAGLMRFAGPGLVGVRLGVALIGAVTVIPVYGLARLAWGRTAAIVAAFAVAASATYIHYSRVSIINVTTPFWWAVCFYFLLRGLRSRRPGDFVWAGLAAGTSMYTYYGARLLPYLLLVFFGYLILFHYRASRERLGHFALLGVGFFVGFGPLIGYFMRHPDMWAGRGLSTAERAAGHPRHLGCAGQRLEHPRAAGGAELPVAQCDTGARYSLVCAVLPAARSRVAVAGRGGTALALAAACRLPDPALGLERDPERGDAAQFDHHPQLRPLVTRLPRAVSGAGRARGALAGCVAAQPGSGAGS